MPFYWNKCADDGKYKSGIKRIMVPWDFQSHTHKEVIANKQKNMELNKLQ